MFGTATVPARFLAIATWIVLGRLILVVFNKPMADCNGAAPLERSQKPAL
jgi:hypothetical protein